MALIRGGRDKRIATHPAHQDPQLRGRTYAIPFDAVWNAAVRLAAGGIPRWLLTRQDDVPGILQAEVRPLLWGENGDVMVRIKLDADAQTRVDMVASSRGTGRDWGANRRRIRSFFRALDESLGATGPQVISPAQFSGISI